MRLLATIFLITCALPAQTPKSALDKKAFAEYMRQVELLPPQMEVRVLEPKATGFPNFVEVPVEVVTPNGVLSVRYFASMDGRLIVKGTIFDVNKHPFQPELDKLKTDKAPMMGSAAAPVTIVVFSDFQCPNCKDTAKVLKENLLKTFPKEVKLHFKNYPLEQLHPWAKTAAIAGRCVYNQNPALFWDFHDWVFEYQSDMLPDNLRTKAIGWADTKNLDSAKLGQCIETKATEADVNREIAEGRSLQISGTPTIYINGRPVPGSLPWQQLEQVIRREVGFQEAAAKAAEKCCEVSLPSLVAPAKK